MSNFSKYTEALKKWHSSQSRRIMVKLWYSMSSNISFSVSFLFGFTGTFVSESHSNLIKSYPFQMFKSFEENC